jgi:hypothetical protein
MPADLRVALLTLFLCAVLVQSVVFESYHIQGGTDRTGVPTKLMSVNATVRLRFRNRATFFSLHVTATPFTLFYDDLTVASGEVVYAIFITLLCCRFFRISSCIILPHHPLLPYWKVQHAASCCSDWAMKSLWLLLVITAMTSLKLDATRM